jgi:hypothetical protein
MNLITLHGYLADYEADFKRMYICFANDEFTEKYINNKLERVNLDYNPVKKEGYKNKPPGFFVKYNGTTIFKDKYEQLCALDDIKDNHVEIKVIYKTYDYAGKNGWNLTCKEIQKK